MFDPNQELDVQPGDFVGFVPKSKDLEDVEEYCKISIERTFIVGKVVT